MASLLTGTNPSRHGVRRIEHALPGELPTLARMLHDAGYRTLGVQTNPWLHSRYCFVRFGTAEQVNDLALTLLEEAGRGRPVYLYLHYMDMHAPYRPGLRWFHEPALEVPCRGPVADEELENLYRRQDSAGPTSIARCALATRRSWARSTMPSGTSSRPCANKGCWSARCSSLLRITARSSASAAR